ncbi:MAG: PEP-CTERM sorting domain-containing protein [Planctomycetes bacterium]|nr:PEP-CTERM sorting domain-containing protein [Planctomycetota bacterium]
MKTITTFTFLLAALAVTIDCPPAAHASHTAINPTYRGYTSGSGSNWRGYSPNNFYYTKTSGPAYRNFFVYDLSSLNNVWISNGSLRLRNGTTNYTGTKTLTLRDFDVSSAFSPAASYGDAGSGAILGSGTFAGSNSGQYFNFNLNSTGLSSVQNAILAGGTNYFGLGGILTAPSGRYAFDYTRGNPADSQLELGRVPNSNPIAYSDDKSILVGEDVLLDGSGSSDVNSNYGDLIVSYEWDIDNNGSFDASSPFPTLGLSDVDLASYGLGAGIHDVRLKVTDRWGATSLYTSSLEIAAIPEPSTLLMGVLAGLGMLVRRRRNK